MTIGASIVVLLTLLGQPGAQSSDQVDRLIRESELRTASLKYSTATFCLVRKDFEQAESILTQALAIREKHLDPNDRLIALTLSALGEALAGLGRYDRAEAAYRRGLAIVQARPQSPDPLLTELRAGLAKLPGASQPAAPASDTTPFLGAWKGTLGLPGLPELEIGLEFTLDESGRIKGTYHNITQEAYGLKLAQVEIKDRTISFIIDDPIAPGEPTFKGTLDETGRILAGGFSQFGTTGTFSVKKR